MNLVNRSWLELKPNENHNGNQEWFEDYYPRISQKSDYAHIPEEVYEQWIHPHHKNNETLLNYAWLDFRKIVFKRCEWSLNQLIKLNVISHYEDHFIERASYNDYSQFCCIDIDLAQWKQQGTWRTPPIVLDVSSLTSPIPEWADINGPFQLVEGHSRLGYLNSAQRIAGLNKGIVKGEHTIYLMSEIV